jgi:hypothetical protein
MRPVSPDSSRAKKSATIVRAGACSSGSAAAHPLASSGTVMTTAAARSRPQNLSLISRF